MSLWENTYDSLYDPSADKAEFSAALDEALRTTV